MEKPCLVVVGKVGGAHGVHGALRIVALGESFETLVSGDRLFFRPAGGGEGSSRELTLKAAQPHGRVWLAQFEEIRDREAARALSGAEILLPESMLPPLEDGEYYHYQLIGLSVERLDGSFVGAITGIIETGSHDVYVTRDGDREFLIPAVEEVIREIDLAGRRVVIDPPEGLLE
jgi:16S rRNA processing protein RimM